MSSGAVEKRGSAATVKACDFCRRRKRRCVWAPGAQGCTPCVNLNETCTTTHVRKQRSKPQRRTRIVEYETRIQRLEALLQDRSDAQPQLPQQPLQQAESSNLLSTWVDNLRGELESNPPEEPRDLDDLLDEYPEGFDAPFEDLQGPSTTSGSNIAQTISPNSSSMNQQSLSEFEPSMDFQQDAAFLQSSSLNSDALTNTPVYAPPLPAQTECDSFLPPPGLATSLLKEFLIDFNTAFPLYRPYVIAEHLRICYIGASDGSAVAWISAYVVFGIAHRLRAMSAEATPQDNEFADIYLTRCIQNVSGLLLAPASMGVVQCLLGVATLIQTSSHPTPHALFVSTALRMAQSLAYNDDQANAADPDQDLEQQRRVFWFAFIKDTEESIMSNAPTAQLRGDIATTCPEDDPLDTTGTVTAAEGSWRVNIFGLRVRLGLLQAEAIESILSVKARTSTQEMGAAMSELFARIQSWRNHEIFQLSAARLAQLLYRSDLVHVLVLEASYFALVFRLHGAKNVDVRTNPFSVEGLAKVPEQSEFPTLNDARRLLDLFVVSPQGDVAVCWQVKVPIIAALVTALSFHLSEVAGSSRPSSSDIAVYTTVLRVVGVLREKSQDLELQRAQSLCMELLMKVETGIRLRGLLGETREG